MLGLVMSTEPYYIKVLAGNEASSRHDYHQQHHCSKMHQHISHTSLVLFDWQPQGQRHHLHRF